MKKVLDPMNLYLLLSVAEFSLIVIALWLVAPRLLGPKRLTWLKEKSHFVLGNPLWIALVTFLCLLIAGLPIWVVLVASTARPILSETITAQLDNSFQIIPVIAVLCFVVPAVLLLLAPLIGTMTLLLDPRLERLAEAGLEGDQLRNNMLRGGVIIFGLAVLLQVMAIIVNLRR